MNYKQTFILLFFAGSITSLFTACHNNCDRNNKTKSELIIFHAGSLSVPMHQLADTFMKENPAIKVLLESAGSRECARKITELKKPCDIIASSDYYVIKDMLMPVYSDWYINFAGNEMCIAYNKQSRLHEKIKSNNWYDVLLDKSVSYGRSNPDADPCGYRTLLLFNLSGKYYKKLSLPQHLAAKDKCYIRPKEVDLLALLESNSIDYIFIYRSVAIQHKLDYLSLPDEINLRNPHFAAYYSSAEVEISAKEKGKKMSVKGEPMVYALSILKNAPNREAAIKFTDLLLSDKGKKILELNGQPSIISTDTMCYRYIPSLLIKYLRK